MDILEHVDDDLKLLKEYVDKSPPKTNFVISVPAFMFLWSDHDVFLEHKRRYTLKQLEQLVLASGLQLTRSSYYYGLLFPIVSLLRIAKNKFKTSKLAQSELAQHNPLTNWTLRKICLLELRFMRWNNLAGLTAFCLAVKK